MNKLLILTISCGLLACNNHSNKFDGDDETRKKYEFFPVTSFLAGQMHEIKSLKLPLRKYTKENNKSDSALIYYEEFRILAKEFMEPDITDPSLKKFYKESSFADQSIPSVTLTYSTYYKDLTIQRMDVIIQPDPVLSDKVKSIYMEKFSTFKDTLILKKMHWKTNKNFYIITSKKAGNQPAIISQLKVIWDY